MFELSNPEQTLLQEISDEEFKRDDIAKTYRLALRSSVKIDWRKVNSAIIDRWSLAGLEYIKKLAWGKNEPPKTCK